MAHQGPSTLPVSDGIRERAAQGTIAKKDSDEEVLLASPRPHRRDKDPGLGMPFESEVRDDRDVERKRRWSLDEARKDEYWRGYYDRKRREKERESQWYPEYRGPQRYLEFDDDRAPSRVYRSLSMRTSKAPVHYRGPRRSFDDLPPRKPAVIITDDEDYEELYAERPVRGSPPPVPPHKQSLDDGSENLRLPFTTWMNQALKGREFERFLFSSGKTLTAWARLCCSHGRICWNDDVLVLRFCRNSGNYV